MKIVLLQDVKAQGKKGDIIEVSEGYARNFLIPRKLGVEATSNNLNTLKLQKANADKRAKEELEKAQKLGAEIEKASVSIAIKGGENGKTYGSVTTKEISQAINEQLGLEVDRKKILLSDPIKTYGTYDVSIKLHRDVTVKLPVKVIEA